MPMSQPTQPDPKNAAAPAMGGVPASPRPNQRVGIGLAISLLFHGALLAVLVVVPYHYYYGGGPAGNESANSGGEARRAPASSGTASPSEITAEKVNTKLTEVLSQVEKLSTEEKLEKLEGAAKQLDKVSSEKGVQELAGLFEGWAGTEKRATAPATKPPAGPFEIDSAQFHDVTREKGPDGRWRYRSVLLDAAGRTMEIDMDPSEGESTYNTFRILKANPLAEKVYRQVTIPILDKLTKAAREAEKLAQEAERQKRAADAAKSPPAEGLEENRR
jgi:hypothetical protein